MRKVKIVVLIVAVLLLTGCQKQNEGKVLNVLNWSAYIPDEVIRDFSREYGIKVNYTTYSSNEELLAKITSSKAGTYDLIFPSDYMLELMISRDLISEMDIARIPNYTNIDSIFLDKSYDPGNKYSLPFLSTIVVIAVNRDKIKDDIKGYNDLLRSEYKNNIVILDDQRIIIGMALLANDYSMNTIYDDQLEEAKDWLLRLKDNVKAYDSDSPKTFFLSDEVDIGVMWNAEAELAREDNSNIEIIYPEEGHAISTDNFAITKGAKNVDNAYLFINYILESSVGYKITKEYPYISSIKSVHNTSISNDLVFKNGFYVKNIGNDTRKYDMLWADIK